MDIREILKCDPDAFMERMLREQPQTVLFDRKDVAKALIAYGESDAASKVSRLSVKALKEIGCRAHQIWSEFSGARGPNLDNALCRAVVEYIEGAPRPLKRKRRILPKSKK